MLDPAKDMLVAFGLENDIPVDVKLTDVLEEIMPMELKFDPPICILDPITIPALDP